MSQLGSWTTKLAGLAAAKGIEAWMSTLQYRTFAYEEGIDPRLGCTKPRIYVFWHEYIFLPLYIRPHCNLVMLLSRHKDAEILARVAHHMGFDCVRGSTKRGGATALLEMRRHGRHMHLTMTPDGPRGPRRELSTGPIFLASKLGLPIVPLGFGYDRPWRMNSWDKFAVPRPFSRARSVLGPEIHVPANLERDDLETYRQSVERLLTDLTDEAEDWAVSGAHRQGEICQGRCSCLLPSRQAAAPVADAVPLFPFAADSPAPRKSA
ncbi:MAG: lysophospholipid acyltransferase family protein [Pirellulales bacterium]|nr:lysophospholipid acyltransferase family protein [Pirellulales bacterium]